jgi:nucleoid DNA-binding protein
MIVSKTHIVAGMMQKTGWSNGASKRVLNMVLNEITEALSRGDSVHIYHFGMFKVVTKHFTGNRFGYDPISKKHPVVGRMSARRAVVRFTPTRTGRLNEALKNLLPKKEFFCRPKAKCPPMVDSL